MAMNAMLKVNQLSQNSRARFSYTPIMHMGVMSVMESDTPQQLVNHP